MDLISKTEFIKLIKANQGLINSLCKIYFASEEDRKDSRQDIILQLWRAYPTFRNEAKISTWIYRVALNAILSKNRKDKRRISTESLSSYDFSDIVTPVFADDEVQHLQQAINMLQDLDKAIVILHLEGYSHREIAATLSQTETNISTRFSRIKTQLQRIFKSRQYESR
jgi:RNA polymerase sigma-70 factor, ECF subfamily